jgi:hypothetical protein
MMHDVDDATLMQALRDADPLSGSTLDDRTRRQLEHDWRQAMAPPVEDSSARPRTIGALGASVQPVAAAIMALVIIAGGVLVTNVVAQRGEGVTDTKPDAGGVEGSYRAVQQDGEDVLLPPVTFLVAGGRALIRHSSGPMSDVSPAGAWRGFGDVTSMRFEQEMFDGDQMYLLIRANGEQQPRWYRYSGGLKAWPPGLAETPQPVFEEGTRGFERVDDEDAQAKGLTRYTADVDAADLDFLGWFGPANDTFGPPVVTVDIWVDADGRVRRLKEMSRTAPEMPTITRFDRFDAVDPIDLPYPEADDAPVAKDIAGLVMYAYGDPAFADELRERVTAELEGDADIAEFEIFERSAAERNDGPILESELFVAALRYTDDITVDLDAQRRKLDQFLTVGVGAVPANVSEGDVPADPQGYAALYIPAMVSWMTLEG